MTVLVVGGRGFIGSHLCRAWDARSYDLRDGEDARDVERLVAALRGVETLVHLASNADIAAGADNPMLDFNDGTVVTASVCEAARLAGTVKLILYASGSGVYGHPWDQYVSFYEDDPMGACSPYGASKVAGEALVSAYAHMYGIRGLAFRFANVVGPDQTHGVALDFMRKLMDSPDELEILGDGRQRKNYVGVDDVIRALEAARDSERPRRPFDVFNVSGADSTTVDDIAFLAAEVLGLSPRYRYADAWPGDVPQIRLNATRIRNLGWECTRSSLGATRWAMEAILKCESSRTAPTLT